MVSRDTETGSFKHSENQTFACELRHGFPRQRIHEEQ
jgi:hypothetical protein